MITIVLAGLYLILGYAWAELIKATIQEQKHPSIRRWGILYWIAFLSWPVSIVIGILHTLRTKEIPR